MSELLNGQATTIKNKEYLTTKEYVEPFLEKMSKHTNDFRVHVKLPDQLTKSGDVENITYNRVLIEAVLPKENTIDNHDEVIGLVYGLDVRKPISKVYRGYLNRACTNLCVFDPLWMVVNEMKPGEEINMDIKKLLELPSTFDLGLKKLKADFIEREKVTERLGGWVDATLRQNYYNGIQNVRMSPTVPVEAYKSLFIDESSDYFVPLEKEASMFDVYNAFTQIITDDSRDIMNKFEKTMMVNSMLGVK